MCSFSAGENSGDVLHFDHSSTCQCWFHFVDIDDDILPCSYCRLLVPEKRGWSLGRFMDLSIEIKNVFLLNKSFQIKNQTYYTCCCCWEFNMLCVSFTPALLSLPMGGVAWRFCCCSLLAFPSLLLANKEIVSNFFWNECVLLWYC